MRLELRRGRRGRSFQSRFLDSLQDFSGIRLFFLPQGIFDDHEAFEHVDRIIHGFFHARDLEEQIQKIDSEAKYQETEDNGHAESITFLHVQKEQKLALE